VVCLFLLLFLDAVHDLVDPPVVVRQVNFSMLHGVVALPPEKVVFQVNSHFREGKPVLALANCSVDVIDGCPGQVRPFIETPVTVPSAPQSFTATGGANQVILSWAAPASNGGSPITSYKVYRGTVSNGETLLATLGVVLSYTDSAVTIGITYYYKVAAANGIGTGPNSTEQSAMPVSLPTARTR
jgi:hypothetical protein